MKKEGLVKYKNAQFYLIAAIIIVTVIIGLSTVTNYVLTKDQPLKFYDLSSEAGEEGARVVDYGIYNAADIQGKIETFLSDFLRYSEEKEEDTEFVFIYGNEVEATATAYTTEGTGGVGITYGDQTFTLYGEERYVPETVTIQNLREEVGVNLLGRRYGFTLREGENFLFVISKKRGEETYVTGSG